MQLRWGLKMKVFKYPTKFLISDEVAKFRTKKRQKNKTEKGCKYFVELKFSEVLKISYFLSLNWNIFRTVYGNADLTPLLDGLLAEVSYIQKTFSKIYRETQLL